MSELSAYGVGTLNGCNMRPVDKANLLTAAWNRPLTAALAVYGALSLAGLAQLAVVWIWRPNLLLELLGGDRMVGRFPVLIAFAITWLTLGSLLTAARMRWLNRDNAVFAFAFASVVLVHVNIFSERVWFGDYRTYVQAAANLVTGNPLPERYLYPPAWATFLSVFYRIGGRNLATFVCYLLNPLSFVCFFPLMVAMLRRFNCSLSAASLLTAAAMLLNVPILRNMAYLQVNLILTNLVLLGVLAYPKHRIASALALCLGVNLKLFPLILIPLFLWRRDWRWILAFGLGCAAVVCATVLPYGISPYRQFVLHLHGWRDIAPRAASIDSFVILSARAAGASDAPARALSLLLKATLALLALGAAVRAIRTRAFTIDGDDGAEGILCGTMPLLFFYVIASPTVWVHHLVMLIPAAAATLLLLKTPSHAVIFGAAYALTFLVPTFDMYPWSFLRLAGWILLLTLTAVLTIPSPDPTADWRRRF